MQRLVPLLSFLTLVACGEDRDLRVWRPEDHGPPRSGTSRQVAPDDVGEDVRMLYRRHCAECHGRGGRGEVVEGERTPDLTKTRLSDPEIVGRILEGREKMPAFAKKLSREDARALVKLLRRF